MEKGSNEQDVKYPREDLSLNCTRRTFFRALLQEAAVIHGALKGKPGCRISELGSLPDEQLAQVRPVMNPDYEICLEKGEVWARHKSKEMSPLRLFAVEEKENLLPFNMFNGGHTLDEITRHLAQEMDWEEAEAFAHLRDFFLSLVERAVCLPKYPLR
jgi:hypothetical protein